jgi:hypothetical protein
LNQTNHWNNVPMKPDPPHQQVGAERLIAELIKQSRNRPEGRPQSTAKMEWPTGGNG